MWSRAAAGLAAILLAACQPRGKEAPVVSPALDQQEQAGPPETGLSWKRPAGIDPIGVAKALDESIGSLEGARAEIEFITLTPDGRGSNKLNWLIESPSRFYIEFVRTDEMTANLRVVADGERQAVMGSEGWRDFRDQPSGWSNAPSRVLRDFRQYFPRQMARPLVDREGFFVPLLQELRRDGFSVTYETAETNLNNSARPFGRFRATHSRAGSSRIEIRFDGIRLVPLTVVVERGEGDDETIAQWSAAWSFEQTFDPTVFVLPKETNSP